MMTQAFRNVNKRIGVTSFGRRIKPLYLWHHRKWHGYAESQDSIYRDQPLFEDISSFLAGHGYRFLFPYGLVFGSTTGRLQWGDAIFVSADVAVDKARWILGR